MGELRIMGTEGDTKVIWDADNKDEVEAAKDQYKSLTSKKFTAYKVKKDGSKGAKISSFDPEAEKIIMVPPIVGG